VHLGKRAPSIALLALAVVVPAAASSSASAASRVVGHVYVNDNTAGTNTVAAFDRLSDGSLTPLAARRSPDPCQ